MVLCQITSCHNLACQTERFLDPLLTGEPKLTVWLVEPSVRHIQTHQSVLFLLWLVQRLSLTWGVTLAALHRPVASRYALFDRTQSGINWNEVVCGEKAFSAVFLFFFWCENAVPFVVAFSPWPSAFFFSSKWSWLVMKFSETLRPTESAVCWLARWMRIDFAEIIKFQKLHDPHLFIRGKTIPKTRGFCSRGQDLCICVRLTLLSSHHQ